MYQEDLDLAAVGMRIYNRWLADFVAEHPERFIGLIYPPMWDIEQAVKEVEWGAAHGLRGVNFPAPRPGVAGEYDDPLWEPFWAACEEHGLTLATHSGLPTRDVFGPQEMAMRRLESAGWPARRGMHRLVFGGVFERYPGLNLVLTEQARGWWKAAMLEMDSVYMNPSDALRRQVPKPPSEYMKTNVFVGSSFTPPSEVHQAFEDGFADNMLWGRDYPHGEGTYKYPESEDEESLTAYYLRWAFGGIDTADARRILSEGAVRAYHLDADELAATAARIGPSAAEVTRPFDEIPPEWAWHLVDVQSGEIAPRLAYVVTPPAPSPAVATRPLTTASWPRRDLTRLMAPRSIAVVGASPKRSRGTRVLDNLLRPGSTVSSRVVHPTASEVLGVPAYPSAVGAADTAGPRGPVDPGRAGAGRGRRGA